MKLTKHKGVQWIVLGLFMVMTAGCSSQYTMERKLWLANRAAERSGNLPVRSKPGYPAV